MAERWVRERIEALFSGDDLAGVSRINSLLGVNLWDAPSFRADIRIDFHEDGRILRATLLTEPDLRRMADLIEAEADEEEVLRPGTGDWCSGMRRAAKVLRMNANETVPQGPTEIPTEKTDGRY